MALSKTEEQTIRNIIERLKMPRCGCGEPHPAHDGPKENQAPGYEGVSRIYLDTWIIGPMELLLGEDRDPRLAERLSNK